jgi:hypothetical protein
MMSNNQFGQEMLTLFIQQLPGDLIVFAQPNKAAITNCCINVCINFMAQLLIAICRI